jgi:AraC-like DNA-binding protein
VVAQNVGYSDAFSFSKAFKKKTGQSPLHFRKKMKMDRHSEMKF